MKKIIVPLVIVIFFTACKEKPEKRTAPAESVKEATETIRDTVTEKPEKEAGPALLSLDGVEDTAFVRLRDYSRDFVYDMKYATEDNFLKTKVYDCAECYVRAQTAKALIAANRDLMEQGYRIKFFDCYRPHDVQKKMWEIVPNPQYVANPAKGSIHNKGGAVDITLVDTDGNALDMGTGFDFFGKEAHHDYTGLPDEVLANRRLLKETMEKHGFWSIRTEWWHYNLTSASNGKVANFRWECE
ncbi:M15 family metallopeptidase [Sinomicrobium kalidii]|uniref:M15 family metallopeptidase n=1 Tax=Sinomicrobium kalidii TaxID=2900738 RepID=UPI001E3977F0|nr:M15 family metallopeptidase [Sinomicrobium kalidii]UGU16701.1 M15 family metallopeptidase [Sinomicrobium kalidii]